jgi:hypothetical protein
MYLLYRISNTQKAVQKCSDFTPNLGISLGLTIREASLILPISENAALIEKKTPTQQIYQKIIMSAILTGTLSA